MLVAMLLATGVGAWGLHGHPLDPANVYLQIVELSHPTAFRVIVYGYATLWFTTPFLAASVLGSLLTIVVYRHEPRVRQRPLPPYPEPESRRRQMLVLGEQHFPTTSGRAPRPRG